MRQEPVKSKEFEFRGIKYSVKIYQDECYESPREWNNLGHMVCWHRKYDLGDKHNISVPEFMEEIKPKTLVCLPLFLMDHSGITMKTSSETFRMCDSAGWDWGQVGFIYVMKEEVEKEFGKNPPNGKREWTIKKIKEILENEVEVYAQYLTGDVYGWVSEDEDGKHYASCWGYYGSSKENLEFMFEEGKDAAEYYITKEKEYQKKWEEML